jgi:hypothetical protein
VTEKTFLRENDRRKMIENSFLRKQNRRKVTEKLFLAKNDTQEAAGKIVKFRGFSLTALIQYI